MFTQCPQCQTVFEINASHLKAANGDVRCGHCLNVFNAVENLSEEIPRHDIQHDDVHEPETTDTEIATDAYQQLDDQHPGDQQADQPAWETEATTGIEAVESQRELTEEDHELSEFFSDVMPDENDVDVDYDSRVRQKATTGLEERFFYGGANESLINKILDETITEDSLSYDNEEEDDKSESAKVKQSQPDTDKARRNEEAEEEEEPAATKSATKKVEEENNPTLEIPPLLVEDLESDQEEQTGHNKFWLVGSLVLMLTFALQAIYFSRDELAKNPNYYPWLTKACQTLGCVIAVPYDINKIEIIGRDVRSHPNAPRALIAGTTLINNARFNQPYPLLTLTFSDMTGTIMAQRRFTPREYLKPGTDIKAGMKPDVPVQVQLELVDPGKNAVNYEFHAEADPRAINPRT
jgi:predicted Zn finger-like uncharacterized protein